MVSNRTILLAGTAVAATAIVAYGIRKYRQRERSGCDIDDVVVGKQVKSKGGADPTSAKKEISDEAAERQQEAQRAKDRGNKRFQGKQYKQAIEEYSKAIELLGDDQANKNLAVYFGNRAQCHFLMEDFERALSDCDASISVDPKYVKALIRRGSVHEKLKNLEQARSE